MSDSDNVFAILTNPQTQEKTVVVGSSNAVRAHAKTYYGDAWLNAKDERTLASTSVITTQWLVDNNINSVRYL